VVKFYTTVRPNKTPVVDNNADKKEAAAAAIPTAYYGDYFVHHHQPSTAPAPQNAFIKYYISAAAATPSAKQRKPAAATSSKKPSYTPVLFSTPQSDYLTFRYSELHRTQTPKYEASSTSSTTSTPLVEITSPKNYIVPHAHTPSTTKQVVTPAVFTGSSTPSYSLAYEYPEAAQFAYAAPLPPPAATPAKIPQPKAIPLVGYARGDEHASSSSTPAATRTALKHDDISSMYPAYHQAVTSSPSFAATEDDITNFSVDDIFRGYNLNKQLPERITPENIKDSIKTLSSISQPTFIPSSIIPNIEEEKSLRDKPRLRSPQTTRARWGLAQH
jgi:hypothetical protein